MIALRMMLAAAAIAVLTLPGAPAQAQAVPDSEAVDTRAATGGAQTLEDILARQKGLKIDDSFRRGAVGDSATAPASIDPLGTLGGVSDPELWRALRYGAANVTTSSRSPAAGVIIQDGGLRWLQFREGPLAHYGGYLLLGMVIVLVLFYLIRGKIRIEGEKTGEKILRFNAVERFGHWLMAGSFVVLALTGLVLLFGRLALIPLLGKEAYAPIAAAGKWIHNNIAWAFMLGLMIAIVVWISHNFPNKHDLKWLAKGGGLFSKGVHPPARKFNAGQKIIFWAVVLLGISISISGLSLLFPFELPMFAKTFDILNALGLPQIMGLGELPSALTPHQEMQLSQVWHGIVAFIFMAIIIAHIYLGSIGMEGAFDAVGTGEVEVQWAKEHHSLWYEEVTGADAHASASPAE
ncbi:Formate dehydrogenase, cytochrome b556(fdo) subunit [Defluviimonas aquaemixtae]|uniref:Formate dehydrogenase, cytochrome b556(Fdo) subunit n=1 Tax=Albidovulum aquaemixtae TaxID=1542388 RepID=A0A2R8BKU4_9RHOB|nr:formate dehydrogenase subunit gamma [Defluviimonas aquaemixtae]SPH24047.1 Formate dehydrogenase, cytochrome b556(fdo) subunit [Defluviimonas aquaemixtae]